MDCTRAIRVGRAPAAANGAHFAPQHATPPQPECGFTSVVVRQSQWFNRVDWARTMNACPRSVRWLAATLLAGSGAPGAALPEVDFRHSPPEWQTAICLPDDPHKSLVDHQGALLYHHERRGREFGTRVSVRVTAGAVWRKQELHSPRVPIVKTLRTAGDLEIVEEAFAASEVLPARRDLILVRVTNRGTEPIRIDPQVVVDTVLDFRLAPEDQQAVIDRQAVLTASRRLIGVTEETRSRRAIQLEAMAVPPGETAVFFVQYHDGEPADGSRDTVAAALAARDRAVAYWEQAALPYGRVHVPNTRIQALLDAAIRNLWQAREIKQGLPAFQVGPTWYRGLWIVDAAFLLETATLLGAADEARAGIAYALARQQPDGRIEVMPAAHKENGIVLWTCVRHAQLTRDRAWLETVWPNLERLAGYIRELRRATRRNESPLDDGLMPPGFPDGGIGGVDHDYTNTYWNLVGLKTFAEAAVWLGRSAQAAEWQAEYDDFMDAFRRAAARDRRRDAHGNAYLPALMGPAGADELPQRGQWTFCLAVHPGKLFARDDPLVRGNLAMLAATERQGMVYGTGWHETGIWTYFASLIGHAWLWQGEGGKAQHALHAFANHAAPTLVWREEQSLTGEPPRNIGDMPHNWAGAEFIRLTIHLLALERGGELHLFEGLPREWTRRGMVTKLTAIATPFGPLSLELQVGADEETARLRVAALADSSCRKVVVHLGGWASPDRAAVLELDPNRTHERVIPLASASVERR